MGVDTFRLPARRRIVASGAAIAALLLSVTLSQGPSAQAQTAMGPVNVAQTAELVANIRTFDVVSGDWDKQNGDDLLVIPHDPDALRRGETASSIPIFFENDGDGTYSRMPHNFPGRDRHGCAMDDMNEDSRLDFFCTEGFSSTRGKELGIQLPDGSFDDQAYERGMYIRGGGRYRGVALFDANDDGYQDVYLTRYYGPNNWDGNFTPAEEDPYPNEFWLSRLSGNYYTREPSFGLDQPIGAPKDSSSCVQGADYNGDGKEDLLVCGYTGLHLYRNNAGESFTDVTTELGVGGFSIDARLVDLDGDGHNDLVRTSGRLLVVRLWNGSAWNAPSYSLSFDKGGQDLAVGDFNGDGRRDIYLTRACINRVDRSDILLTNNGGGKFSRTDLPALAQGKGCGQAVAATDYDRDGRTDFAVLNGHKKKAGPIQLWSYKPR